ncbi:MAG: acetolactate synthase large subunit, partial [Alphaproteobacteria bacterium]|nr:acetolactate synthase large subunit [Alphaproteobacteria bacterium]
PGAVLIELPEDLAEAEVKGKPMPSARTRRPAADHKAVAEAVDVILKAKNPMVIAGNGAVRKRAARQLRRFARKTGIGVANTFMGKGAVAMSDPHCLFTIGLQARDYVNLALDECDVVIAVGYDLVEYSPVLWNKGGGKKIVHIDFTPAEVDEHYPVTVDVVGDIADALWQINETLNQKRGDKLPLHDIAKRGKLRQAMLDEFGSEKDDKSFPVKPQRILWDVRQALGPADILLSDVGAHKMWISRYYQCEQPNTCLISNGFCSMGFALPGAIGAKIAFPDRRVLAICGDAGFLMNVQDLETAVRLNLNIVVMVWDDGEYGLIKWKQQNHFKGRHSELAFKNPDFELLARSFGAWGRRVGAPGELKPVLEEAFRQKGPALVAVPVDYGENLKLTKRLGDLAVPI